MRWYQKYFLKNKKKYHFDAFSSEKHFEKQPQPHFQTVGVTAITIQEVLILVNYGFLIIIIFHILASKALLMIKKHEK